MLGAAVKKRDCFSKVIKELCYFNLLGQKSQLDSARERTTVECVALFGFGKTFMHRIERVAFCWGC